MTTEDGARDVLLVTVTRLEGKFDAGMVELRASVNNVIEKFNDFTRRTELKQQELEQKVDSLWDRYNRGRGIVAGLMFILTVLSVYAALRTSGVHW